MLLIHTCCVHGPQLVYASTHKCRWLKQRFLWGHSEWKSDTYLQFQMRSVSALASLAPDEDIRTQAAMVLDLLLYDLSIHSFSGGIASSRGRAYQEGNLIFLYGLPPMHTFSWLGKFLTSSQAVATTIWLLTGQNQPRNLGPQTCYCVY